MVLLIFIFTVLAAVIMMIQYLTKAASGDFFSGVIWLALLYNIPGFVIAIIPISVLLSIVIVYGRMFYDSELFVAFSCGFTWLGLIRATFVPVFFVSIAGAILSFYIVPLSNGYRKALLSEEFSATDLSYITPETFTHIPSSDAWVYASSEKDGHLKNVFVFTNKVNSNEVILADSASELKGKVFNKLNFSYGNKYVFPKTKSLSYLDKISFDSFSTDLMSVEVRSLEGLEFLTLNNLFEKKLSSGVISEIYVRFSSVISIFIMMAFGLVLSSFGFNKGRYGNIILSVLIYIIYFNLISIFQVWAKK
tara:strand:+ start:76 stop:996 length:921 start_codon:yes stop_codon:yes gene_type:complete